MSDQEQPFLKAQKAYQDDDENSFAPSVYISYRPEDNERIIKALRDWFALRLGPMNVVIDVDIPPFVESVDFYIRERMKQCNIFVCIIGSHWLQQLNMSIENDEIDLARLEARIAIEENLAIAPVYIDGASPLREVDLPLDLVLISKQQYSIIDTESAFEENMLNLIEDLRQTAISHSEEMDRIDVDVHYAQFEKALAEDRLEDALVYLHDIHDYGIVPRPFRLQIRQRIRTLKRRIQIRDGRPIYDRIAKQAETDPATASEKLGLFLAKFPEVGDPLNLVGRLHFETSPSRLIINKIIHNEDMDGFQRLSAGRELNQYGDPRPGVHLHQDGTPDIGWIKIPEGDFIFGFDRHIDLPEFFISRYTVTNAQFQAFIDDNGFENEQWWAGLSVHEQASGDLRWDFDNYPRVRVSWFAAVAFCRWLSDKVGYEIRLPTEMEWEKAARGVNGSIYPWGPSYIAGHSNINEAISGISSTNLREPCAVGMYPHARSPFGVDDMIGNVWEWCLNDFSDPTNTHFEGTQKRALRGGAWSSDRLFAHTVRRRGELPTTQFNDIGFRIVCESLPDISLD